MHSIRYELGPAWVHGEQLDPRRNIAFEMDSLMEMGADGVSESVAASKPTPRPAWLQVTYTDGGGVISHHRLIACIPEVVEDAAADQETASLANGRDRDHMVDLPRRERRDRTSLSDAASIGSLVLGRMLERTREEATNVVVRAVTAAIDRAERDTARRQVEQAEGEVQREIYEGLEDRLQSAVNHVKEYGVGAKVIFPMVYDELRRLRRAGWDINRRTGDIRPYDPLHDNWGVPDDAEDGMRTIRLRKNVDWS